MMKVCRVGSLAVGLTMIVAAGASAQGRVSPKKTVRTMKTSSAIGDAMGDVRWGWTRSRVLRHHRQRIQEAYRPLIAKASDAIEEDNLRHKMNREVEKIVESYVEFDGTTSGYDSGFLRDEFAHNNSESMLRVNTPTSEDYYFFYKNRLWKRYRALKASVFGDATFKEFGNALQGRYGRAKIQTKALPDGAELKWYRWSDRRTSVRAIDNNPFYGLYCLVFEDQKKSNKLNKVRAANKAKPTKSTGIVDMVVQDGDEAKDDNADIADRISGEIRRKSPPPKSGELK